MFIKGDLVISDKSGIVILVIENLAVRFTGIVIDGGLFQYTAGKKHSFLFSSNFKKLL